MNTAWWKQWGNLVIGGVIILIGGVMLYFAIVNSGRIETLEGALSAQTRQFRECAKPAAEGDPACDEPVVEPGDVDTGVEIQEDEIQQDEVQEREDQEREQQDREVDQLERQDREFQNPEINELERQESETDDAEVQDDEVQDDEVQDEEIQESEDQEAEVQEDEIQNEEVDDPDPNSALDFQTRDDCNPVAGEFVTDASVSWERSPGVVTLVLSCTTAPVPAGVTP